MGDNVSNADRSQDRSIVEKRGPWTVLQRQQLHSTKYGLAGVYTDKVIRPDGRPGEYHWIEIRPGAMILPIGRNSDNGKWDAYMGREFQYAINRVGLEGVGGGREKDEPMLVTAQRELEEELGITAKTWTDLGTISPITGIINTTQYLFLAQDLTFGNHRQESTENISLAKLPLEEAINKVMSGEIYDAQTSILLLKAQEHLRRTGQLR